MSLAPLTDDAGGDLFRHLAIPSMNQYDGSLGRERTRDRLTNSLTAARYESTFALKVQLHALKARRYFGE